MPLLLIAAISKNNCIGNHGEIPWRLPEDMKHFKNLTMDKIVLMGRKTWESLPEKWRPLPGRKNIVITRQNEYAVPDGVEIYHTVEAAIAAHPNEDACVIGGAEIYRQTIDQADTLYITHVEKTVDGDAFFPEIDATVWKETEREKHEGYAFVTYKRMTGN